MLRRQAKRNSRWLTKGAVTCPKAYLKILPGLSLFAGIALFTRGPS
jgi:hypothetical protein